MFRINYLRPEQMPPHQRDFPRREQIEELPGAAGSRALAMMVGWYLVAMFAGILLLGYLTASERPSATAAAAGTALAK
jgi:tetrahydromethanopterin S-methyltransferase subunit B